MSDTTGQQVTTAGNIIMFTSAAMSMASGNVLRSASFSGGGKIIGASITGVGLGLMLTGLGPVVERKASAEPMYNRANTDSAGRIMTGIGLMVLPTVVSYGPENQVAGYVGIGATAVGVVGLALIGVAQDIGGLVKW
jgi:hypothetical protein